MDYVTGAKLDQIITLLEELVELKKMELTKKK